MVEGDQRLRSTAEHWLSKVDNLVLASDSAERASTRHAAYRAAAIAVMMSARGPMRADSYQGPRKGGIRRIGLQFETPILTLSLYTPTSVSVGMARDTHERASALSFPFLGRRPTEPPVVAREDFYIRNLTLSLAFGDRSDPDIKQEDWSIPRNAFRLPSPGTVAHDIYMKDMPRFGREIAHLATALNVELPTTLEAIQATKL